MTRAGLRIGAATACARPGPIRRLAAAIAGLDGWRRWLAALLLGGLAAAALPPVYALPVLPVAFTGLVWLIDGAGRRRTAFAVGWWFGFGHFVAGLYWVANALLVEPDKFAWLIPFADSCIPAYLALYTGAAALIVRLSRARGFGRVLILAAGWTAMEWLRGIVLTGFPWNPIGLALEISPAPIQLAAVFGEYGLSFVVVLVAAAPAVLGDAGGAAEPARRRAAAAVIGAFALFAAVWAGGAIRLAGATAATVSGVALRIVQGNVPQTAKFDPALRDRHLIHYLNLSRRPPGPAGPPTDLIWPETAVAVVLDRDPLRRRAMAGVVPPGGLLLTGTIRLSPPGTPFRAWNSLQALDHAGRIVATYDKAHLVPFGEYLPLRGLLSAVGLSAIAADRGDFTAGPGPRTLHLPGLPPVSPLICYEAIFPGDVVAPGTRPGWLLNVTNDAWFGDSAGPHQHFASARLRAVEEGLPLIRAANTGISAVIDGFGRIRAELPLGVTGVLDSPLPMALAPTPFVRFGNLPLGALIVVAFAAGLLTRRGAGAGTAPI